MPFEPLDEPKTPLRGPRMGVAEDFMSDLRLVVVGGVEDDGGEIPFDSSMEP